MVFHKKKVRNSDSSNKCGNAVIKINSNDKQIRQNLSV